MSAKEQRWPSEPALDNNLSLTLDPMRSDGPDSLDTHDVPALKRVTLDGLEVFYDNDLNDTEILRAADLHTGCPPGATLHKAHFLAISNSNPTPQEFTIQPPRLLTTSSKEILPALIEWAKKRHFCLPAASAAAANLALILLLASIPPDCADDQDIDTDLDRTHVPGAVPPPR